MHSDFVYDTIDRDGEQKDECMKEECTKDYCKLGLNLRIVCQFSVELIKIIFSKDCS